MNSVKPQWLPILLYVQQLGHVTSRASITRPIRRKNNWSLPDGSTGRAIWKASVLPMTGHEATMEGLQPLHAGIPGGSFSAGLSTAVISQRMCLRLYCCGWRSTSSRVATHASRAKGALHEEHQESGA